MWPSLETTPKTITVAENFVFITLGTLNRPDLHFKDAGNGPVFITLVDRGHELYCGASPISLVEYYVTSSHDKGSYHSWDFYITGQLVDGLQQKIKTGFH